MAATTSYSTGKDSNLCIQYLQWRCVHNQKKKKHQKTLRVISGDMLFFQSVCKIVCQIVFVSAIRNALLTYDLEAYI